MKTVTMYLLLIALATGWGYGGDTSVEPRPPDDFPPWAVETFEAQTLTAERKRLIINFATAFEDPERRPLSYSAESSDVSVLTAAMSGSVLTTTPLAEGSATVSVKASDPGGNSATITHLSNGERTGTSRRRRELQVTTEADRHGKQRGVLWTVRTGGRLLHRLGSANLVRDGIRSGKFPVSPFEMATAG